jgi:hypothetical protein
MRWRHSGGRYKLVLKFTDSNKWDDPWFESIPPWAQLLWIFVCDKCDHVGVLAMSRAQADRRIPGINWDSLDSIFDGRMVQLGPDLWLLPKYLYFQQPNLGKNQNMQKAVDKLLDKHGLQFDGRLVFKKSGKGVGSPLVGATKPLEGSHVQVTVPVTVPVEVKSSGTSKALQNRARLERELRRQGMGWKGEALTEWADLLAGTGACPTVEDCLDLVRDLSRAGRKAGTPVAFARNAVPFLDDAVKRLRKAQAHEKLNQRNTDSAAPSPPGDCGDDRQGGSPEPDADLSSGGDES